MCLPVKPYKIEREWKNLGLSCAVVLAREVGHRCGYVRVPPGHSLFGQAWDGPSVDVHGGLTFAQIEPCTEHEDGQGWWFGFDCAHSMDASFDPSMRAEDCATEEARASLKMQRKLDAKYPIRYDGRAPHYWSESEVVAETEHLAAQIAAL